MIMFSSLKKIKKKEFQQLLQVLRLKGELCNLVEEKRSALLRLISWLISIMTLEIQNHA